MKMSSLPTIKTITDTIKSYINTNNLTNLNINIPIELPSTEYIKSLTSIESPQQLATLICSASIASTLGYKLYQKYKHNSQYQITCTSSNSNQADDDTINPLLFKKILTASAPGKVILCGEHAVIYGVKAISTAINKRTSITIYEPIDIHRVIDLSLKQTPNESKMNNPTNSLLILKLNHAQLSWKLSDLIAIHNLNINKWDLNLIKDQYHLLKPEIQYTGIIDIEWIKSHPLYSENEWEKDITSVILLLLFQCFNTLFSDQIFISYGIIIQCKSDIPIGAGLGSSSAWSTALSAALYYYWVYVTAGQRKTKICSSGVQTVSRIWKLAYESEKINHGNPSGIDNTTSVYGGYVKFKNKENFRIIDTNKHFVHKIPILVINTGIVGNTNKLVNGVKNLYNKHGNAINGIFQSIDEIGDEMINILLKEKVKTDKLYKTINELFSMNHGLLVSLGCGHSVIDQIKAICSQYGFGKGFKITGAGGGGCVIVSLLNKYNGPVFDKKCVEKLRQRLLKNGYESYLIETGQKGLICKFH